MKPGRYTTGQFARKIAVSVRTLRYYDAEGLLVPSERTEAGYRLYSDADLPRLQQILALRFLGFSLDEIRSCLKRGPQRLDEVLQRQRRLIVTRRSQLDAVIDAIGETQKLLDSGACEWEAIAGVIQVIQMQQDREALQRQYVEDKQKDPLIREAYSDSALQKLAVTGAVWTEEDRRRTEEQYRHLYAEARRLAAAGADPAGPEGQALAKLQAELISAFTQNDPEIDEGLKQYRQMAAALPAEERPFDDSAFDAGPEGNEFLARACAIHRGA